MPWHHKLRFGGALIRTLADIGSPDNAGLAGLPEDLTINSQTVSPTFRYEGADAATGLWTPVVGESLTGTGSGGSVGLDTPLPGTLDEAVDPEGTRYWAASGNSFADITTEDFVFEVILKTPSNLASVQYILNKWVSSTGYVFFTSTTLRFQINGGGTSVAFSANPSTWYHLMVFGDRSGSMALYVNGAFDSSDIISGEATISAANPLELGGRLEMNDGALAYAAMWKQGSWLDTHLQATVAADRFARALGTYSSALATGPSQADLRSSSASLEKQSSTGPQKWFLVGPYWSRLERRPDSVNRYASGFNQEGQETNLITHSHELDNAAWTKTRVTISADSGSDMYGDVLADTIAEDGTASSTHFVEFSFTQSATVYLLQAVVEPLNRRWIQLELDSSTDGAASVYFDLGNRLIGTESGNDAAGIRYLGGNRYFVWMTDTRATAEACSARIYVADGDGGRSFSGATQDSVRACHVLVSASDVPMSDIPTSGATATRVADELKYASLSLPTNGSLACDVLSYEASASLQGFGSVSDGGSNNRAIVYGLGANAIAQVVSGGSSEAVIQVARDEGFWNEYRCTYKTDDVKIYRNGTVGTTDALATMPATLDQLDVGTLAGGGSSANCLVRVRVLSKASLAQLSAFGDIMAKASGYISSAAGVSVGTSYTNIGGTFTSVDLSEFTLSAAGVFTYTGTDTKRFYVAAACSGSKSGGGSVELDTVIEKNGTEVTSSESARDVTGTSIGAWALFADVELATNDTINLAVKLSSGSETITLDRTSIVIIEASN